MVAYLKSGKQSDDTKTIFKGWPKPKFLCFSIKLKKQQQHTHTKKIHFSSAKATFAKCSLPSSSCNFAFANTQQTPSNPLSGRTVLSPSSQYCQISSSTEQMVYGNIIVNIIVISAFVTSWIDLLILCFLFLQNAQ